MTIMVRISRPGPCKPPHWWRRRFAHYEIQPHILRQNLKNFFVIFLTAAGAQPELQVMTARSTGKKVPDPRQQDTPDESALVSYPGRGASPDQVQRRAANSRSIQEHPHHDGIIPVFQDR